MVTIVLGRLCRYAAFLTNFSATVPFGLLPRRWVVERTFAWIGRNRRLAKNFEETIESSATSLMLAAIQLMTRRLANP